MEKNSLNIAIFGGSFDPPHIGHDEIVKAALNALDIDKLIIIPTFCSPFKDSFCATPALRLKWCKRLWARNSRIYISDFEIKKAEPTASITSVRHFKKLLNPSKIYLIIGADCIESLHLWREFEILDKMVEFVIATRKDFLIKDSFKALKKLEINANISSSFIRQSLDFSAVSPKIVDEVKGFYVKQN